jgi:hypothetical protein
LDLFGSDFFSQLHKVVFSFSCQTSFLKQPFSRNYLSTPLSTGTEVKLKNTSFLSVIFHEKLFYQTFKKTA